MRSLELPENKGRDAADTDDKRCNDVSLRPGGGVTVGNVDGDEDESENGNDKNDADDIQNPEQLDEDIGDTEDLEGRAPVVEQTLLLRAMRDEHEAKNQRESADGVDDGPHADAPVPGRAAENLLGDVTADPGVDDERKSRNIAEEQTSAGRGDIGDDDLEKEDDHGIADLVDDRASSKSLDTICHSLDDCTENVEEDGQENELNTTENIGNLSCGRLSGSSNDRPDNVDG